MRAASYRRPAIWSVLVGEKPKTRYASLCNSPVLNGVGGVSSNRSLEALVTTPLLWRRHPFSTLSASAFLGILSTAYLASNSMPPTRKTPRTAQNGSGTNFRISTSRSMTYERVGPCTRPMLRVLYAPPTLCAASTSALDRLTPQRNAIAWPVLSATASTLLGGDFAFWKACKRSSFVSAENFTLSASFSFPPQ